MLASAVLPDAAERGEVRPLGQILPLLRERGVRAVSANGVLGDPAGASATRPAHRRPRANGCSQAWSTP